MGCQLALILTRTFATALICILQGWHDIVSFPPRVARRWKLVLLNTFGPEAWPSPNPGPSSMS